MNLLRSFHYSLMPTFRAGLLDWHPKWEFMGAVNVVHQYLKNSPGK